MAIARVINISREAACCVTLMLLVGFAQRCGGEMPPEYKELFSLPSHEREVRFKEFPLDKQVDAYVYAMYVEPPLTEFIRYLASNGKPVIPHILTRLEVEKSDTAKVNLIYVFQEMHEYHVSLKNEVSTITTLERIVSNMSDEYNKKKAEEYLRSIKTSPGFDRSLPTGTGR